MQITIELKDKEVTRMSSMRAERVGEQMKKELMDIINNKVKRSSSWFYYNYRCCFNKMIYRRLKYF